MCSRCLIKSALLLIQVYFNTFNWVKLWVKLYRLWSAGYSTTNMPVSVQIFGGDPAFEGPLSVLNLETPETNGEIYDNWASSVKDFPKVIDQKVWRSAQLLVCYRLIGTTFNMTFSFYTYWFSLFLSTPLSSRSTDLSPSHVQLSCCWQTCQSFPCLKCTMRMLAVDLQWESFIQSEEDVFNGHRFLPAELDTATGTFY